MANAKTVGDKTIRGKVTLSVAGTAGMDCYTATPDDQAVHSGLIVLQEAFGVNSHIRHTTDRFAQHGLVAIAPELFHRTAPPGFEGDYSNFESVMPHMRGVTEPAAEADLQAAFQWLQSHTRVKPGSIACVGFCMGGRMSFLANAVLPLRAAVSYYGGGIAPSLLPRTAALHAPMLFYWGELDKHIPPEQHQAVIDAMKASGKPYRNVEFSDADHGFNCDERPSYNPQAAQEAWALTLEFLRLRL